MKVITREKHALGDLVRMSDESAVLATYFRNNVLHLFAMPSLLACAFVSNAVDAHRRHAAPGVAHLSVHRLRAVPALERERAARGGRRRARSARAARPHRSRRERHASGGARRPAPRKPCNSRCWRRRPSRPSSATTSPSRCCCKAGSGEITQSALEERCQLMAQRMTMLYGFNSPGVLRPHAVRDTSSTCCARAA